MVKVKEDLTGRVFGRLTVLRQVEDHIMPCGTHEAQWLCRCSCEEHTEIVVWGRNLRRGQTKSCGCLTKERATEFCKSKHKINIYDLSQNFGIGITSNTNQEFYFDLEDYDKIKNYCWGEYINKQNNHHTIEAYIPELEKRVTMAQLITNKNDIDHKNLNTLDNRRDNLRDATRSQQGANRPKQSNNTSGYIGVRWYKRYNKWRAEIKVNKKSIHIGYFDNKEDAIKARLQTELKYFGPEFAPQRHLFEKYGIKYNNESGDRL